MRLLISISVLHWFYFHIFWTLEASDDAFEHGRIVSLPGRSTSESVNNVDVCPLLQSQGRPHVPDDLTTGWCNQHRLNCWVSTRTKVSLETCLDPLGTLHLLQQHSLSFPDWCPFSHAVSPSPIHCSIFSIVFIITRHIVCLHVCLCAFCWKCGLTLAEQIYFHMYKFIFICIKVALFNLCHFIYWDFHIILVNLRNSLYHTLTIVIFVEIFSYPSYFTSRCRKLSFSFLLLQMFETS